MNTSDLNQDLCVTLQRYVKEVPECLAMALVDMQSGLLLAVDTVDSHPREVLDLVAAATGDIFQGTNVVAIENLFKKVRGLDDDWHYFQKITVHSTYMIHVFRRGKKHVNHCLVGVSHSTVNQVALEQQIEVVHAKIEELY